MHAAYSVHPLIFVRGVSLDREARDSNPPSPPQDPAASTEARLRGLGSTNSGSRFKKSNSSSTLNLKISRFYIRGLTWVNEESFLHFLPHPNAALNFRGAHVKNSMRGVEIDISAYRYLIYLSHYICSN